MSKDVNSSRAIGGGSLPSDSLCVAHESFDGNTGALVGWYVTKKGQDICDGSFFQNWADVLTEVARLEAVVQTSSPDAG